MVLKIETICRITVAHQAYMHMRCSLCQESLQEFIRRLYIK